MGEPVPVALVGLHGGEFFGTGAARALGTATVVVGAERHLDSVIVAPRARRVPLVGDLPSALNRIDDLRRAGERVCVLVSGDPGFFGLARLALARLGAGAVSIHPAPSAVSLAFARAGMHWDDAVVVSAHGRDPGAAVEAVRAGAKVAVLCSPDTPPAALGRALLDAGVTGRRAVVASRLEEADEAVWSGDLGGLAAGNFDPLSVVIVAVDSPASAAGISWGRPEAEFDHRAGMITKAEIRAVALGKLSLPPAGVMWDVGAGSGSVAAESTRLVPALDIYAIERSPDDADRLRTNLVETGVHVVEGTAPAALDGLPDPDRAFVGGGGIDVLEAVRRRLRPGGTIVATYASLERAAAAARLLGSLVQVSVSRAVPIGPDGSLRLAGENPVFICWGPPR